MDDMDDDAYSNADSDIDVGAGGVDEGEDEYAEGDANVEISDAEKYATLLRLSDAEVDQVVESIPEDRKALFRQHLNDCKELRQAAQALPLIKKFFASDNVVRSRDKLSPDAGGFDVPQVVSEAEKAEKKQQSDAIKAAEKPITQEGVEKRVLIRLINAGKMFNAAAVKSNAQKSIMQACAKASVTLSRQDIKSILTAATCDETAEEAVPNLLGTVYSQLNDKLKNTELLAVLGNPPVLPFPNADNMNRIIDFVDATYLPYVSAEKEAAIAARAARREQARRGGGGRGGAGAAAAAAARGGRAFAKRAADFQRSRITSILNSIRMTETS